MMLALRMGRTLEELCASMSSAEFSLWVEAYKEDQWGDKWHDWRAGVVASTVANFAGKTLPKGAQNLSPQDFMPNVGKDECEEEDEICEPDPFAFFSEMLQNQ
jgi:hypothetical protein